MILNEVLNKITNFLSKSDLTAKDVIVISVVSSLMAVFLGYILKSVFVTFKKPIINLFQKIKMHIKRKIRIHKGKLNINEYLQLKRKIEEGKKLTKREMKGLKKAEDEISKLRNQDTSNTR
ncbi:hypothetical protein OW763_16365 [Clostridium aestuarii]|uniref:Uncharacterized protein n=1 Tax=Clostridium aestuarii TaxID=338193 RepID=A0ABT4D3R4_9CLOT|nr:hypothetical protein [Clostridium aestuarii]MCY6485886.1 hypothetical protein [Clostridium aestuarii]